MTRNFGAFVLLDRSQAKPLVGEHYPIFFVHLPIANEIPGPEIPHWEREPAEDRQGRNVSIVFARYSHKTYRFYYIFKTSGTIAIQVLFHLGRTTTPDTPGVFAECYTRHISYADKLILDPSV